MTYLVETTPYTQKVYEDNFDDAFDLAQALLRLELAKESHIIHNPSGRTIAQFSKQ